MKRLLLIVIIGFLQLDIAHSQDLIVIEKGDSLNCKITLIERDYIYFTFKSGGETKNTLAPLTSVKSYKEAYFPMPKEEKNKVPVNYQKYRMGIYGGFSYRTAKVSDKVPAEFESYVSGLKRGSNLGADASYFFSKGAGFGVKYSRFASKNEKYNDVYLIDTANGTARAGRLKDNITIQYLGPTFSTRITSRNKKRQFVSTASLGYIFYKDKATVVDEFTIKGNTIALSFNAGLDCYVAKNLYVVFFLDYLSGSLSRFEVDDGRRKQTIQLDRYNLESISRIDIGIGLRWNR